jgi:hypothetical protein
LKAKTKKRLEQEARLVQTSDSSEAIIKNLEDKVAAATSLRGGVPWQINICASRSMKKRSAPMSL